MLVLEMVMMIVIKTEQKNYGVRKKKGEGEDFLVDTYSISNEGFLNGGK
jgi:hypothetical protein